MKIARWGEPPCSGAAAPARQPKWRPGTAAPPTPAIFHLSLCPQENDRWNETVQTGDNRQVHCRGRGARLESPPLKTKRSPALPPPPLKNHRNEANQNYQNPPDDKPWGNFPCRR